MWIRRLLPVPSPFVNPTPITNKVPGVGVVSYCYAVSVVGHAAFVVGDPLAAPQHMPQVTCIENPVCPEEEGIDNLARTTHACHTHTHTAVGAFPRGGPGDEALLCGVEGGGGGADGPGHDGHGLRQRLLRYVRSGGWLNGRPSLLSCGHWMVFSLIPTDWGAPLLWLSIHPFPHTNITRTQPNRRLRPLEAAQVPPALPQRGNTRRPQRGGAQVGRWVSRLVGR